MRPKLGWDVSCYSETSQWVSVSRDNGEKTSTQRVLFNCTAFETSIDVLSFPLVSWQLRVVFQCSFASALHEAEVGFRRLIHQDIRYWVCSIPPHMGSASHNVAQRATLIVRWLICETSGGGNGKNATARTLESSTSSIWKYRYLFSVFQNADMKWINNSMRVENLQVSRNAVGGFRVFFSYSPHFIAVFLAFSRNCGKHGIALSTCFFLDPKYNCVIRNDSLFTSTHVRETVGGQSSYVRLF